MDNYQFPTQERIALAAIVALCLVCLSLLSHSAQAALPSLPTVDSYPRSAQAVQIQRGLQIIQVRPLKTVMTLSKRQAVADRLIVVFRNNLVDADQNLSHLRANRLGGGKALPLLKIGPKAILVDVTGAKSLEDAARAYKADPNVLHASPDWIMHASETPNDPFIGSQGGLNTIQAPAAWNRTHGSTGMLIAVLDTGIDETHPDLAGKVVDRHDFTGSSIGTGDAVGHGTHVAGIAAASTNNAIGIAGVGYNSRLLNVKVLDDSGDGSISMLFNGIYWAADHGAHVINMSLGADQDCSTSWWEDLFDTGRNELRDSIGYAWGRNIVLVAAAGNDGANRQQWPAACPNVVSVANTTTADVKATSSNFGTWVDVAAPGSSIFSTAVPGALKCQSGLVGQFANCSGTSMASPHVAGIAALVRASCGFSSGADIVTRITSTSDAIAGTGTNWQFGRVNALRAVCFPVPGGINIGAVTASSLQLRWSDRTPGETRFEILRQPIGGTVLGNANLSINTLATAQLITTKIGGVGGIDPGGVLTTGTASSIIIVPANTTSYTDSGLSVGASVDYRVRACDGLGCSDWSNIAHGRTGAKLTVSLSAGGKVTSTPAGINCGLGATSCNAVYNPGTVVNLKPIPHVNLLKNIVYEFDHWEGACAGQDFICSVAVTGAKSARAVFVRDPTGGL
jgi:thermitase